MAFYLPNSPIFYYFKIFPHTVLSGLRHRAQKINTDGDCMHGYGLYTYNIMYIIHLENNYTFMQLQVATYIAELETFFTENPTSYNSVYCY